MQYFLLYKPYGVLSQFTREAPDHKVLGDLYEFPKEVYPIGRLDKDSEGLLILTDDKKLNNKLLDPKFEHHRTYWVQVEGEPTDEAIGTLRKGVTIRLKKTEHQTKPAKVKRIIPTPEVPDRDPPVRFRANIPTSWLAITLTEGKNRQVRKMCAKVGFPVLRLIRIQIEDLTFRELKVGQVSRIGKNDLYQLLKV